MSAQNTAKWIWYYGEFEIYHNLLVHCRREDLECNYPCLWALDTPYPNVEFHSDSKLIVEEDTVIHVKANGQGCVWINWDKYPVNSDIKIKAGAYSLKVNVMRTDGGFPSIFLDNKYITTNENWTADFGDKLPVKVGCRSDFNTINDNPDIFPFKYKEIKPVSISNTKDGILYDFGKETMAKINILAEKDTEINIYYGESIEEALDKDNCLIKDKMSGNNDYSLPARAFRYLLIDSNKDIKLTALYEYLDVKKKADFKCDNELLNNIFDVCAYTFELNSREFYLDGIKRDRWVWSGDSYQSFMINNYLYRDADIIKRTIIALLGKPPVVQHINTINDYSMFLIISVYDYFTNFNDEDFIKRIYPRVKALYNFIVTRLDADGFVYEKDEDWVFIDWADFDKNGALCAEQILLWKTYKAMAELSKITGEDFKIYNQQAEVLKQKILQKYWSDEKSAFIDSFSSGKNHVTRHANIFAILYNFVDENTKNKILENVIKNDSVPAITTPYFKFYELLALCECGEKQTALDFIKCYWGDMLSLGATSVWEQFDPNQSSAEHYSMYGAKFGKSLCHAWGSGPVLLLLKYFAGIKTNSNSFSVSPDFKYFNSLNCTVPVFDGEVKINYSENKLTVLSTIDNGELFYNNKTYKLKKDEVLKL